MNIIGASGHAKVVIETLRLGRTHITGVWDDNTSIKEVLNYSINGIVSSFIKSESESVIIAVGNNEVRKEIANRLKGAVFGLAIHPSAVVSESSQIKSGTVIMANASINSNAKIGSHCIINTNASVDHDCLICDFVHISPQVGLAGDVVVGEGTHIGIGANVIQGIKIGAWCTIGAGAVVIRDIPDGATVVGNPGKIIKMN